MRVSVVATVKNEAASIQRLLDSLMSQTRTPAEIVIVDGGSSDGTTDIVRRSIDRGYPVILRVQPGLNISQGRNCAIATSSGDIVAVTDAGVRLTPHWLESLVSPFEGDDSVDVVSGFFSPDPQSAFELAMGSTVLPTLAEIEDGSFLPSSRSVAFRREAWEDVGGYPEWLDYCEDLVFDIDLKKRGHRFVFAPEALVYFRPRSTFRAFFRQYYLYARGDGKALLWTKRHIVRYSVYSFASAAFAIGFRAKIMWILLGLSTVPYLLRPYVRLRSQSTGWSGKDVAAAACLIPSIRLVGDVAKMIGYPVGLIWRARKALGGRIA